MNKRIIDALKKMASITDWKDFDINDGNCVYDMLCECVVLQEKRLYQLRFYDIYAIVVNIQGVDIMFESSQSTGDHIPEDMGWKFDLSSLSEAESYEETIISYRKVNNG